jgi:hypothetical protein
MTRDEIFNLGMEVGFYPSELMGSQVEVWQEFVRRVQEQEREACAKIADYYASQNTGLANSVLRASAYAIRARGEA